MVPCLVYAVCGRPVFRRLLVPLGFLGFALPIGASLEPWLQEVTTRFLTIGLYAAGIPFERQGTTITLASGSWEVAPDCAGLRYLLPGMALGYLYAALVYERALARVQFLTLCAALLLFANGLRAYGIIVTDHLGIADGTDHRVFSYTIYAVVIAGLAWLGRRWPAACARPSGHDADAGYPTGLHVALVNTAGAVALLALPSLIAWVANGSSAQTTAGTISLVQGDESAHMR
jgi:exosortase